MRFHSGHSMRQLFLSSVYWLNWNLKGWFLWMVENWRTQSKTPRTRMRTNNNLNPHVTPGRESDLRHNKGRWVLTPLCHPPPPKFPLSRFSISKEVLQDNLVLLTVFPDCFLTSHHHSARKCIIIVKRNYPVITAGIERAYIARDLHQDLVKLHQIDLGHIMLEWSYLCYYNHSSVAYQTSPLTL